MNSKVDNHINNLHPSTILSVRLKEGGFILLVALAIFLFISLWSFSPNDPGWTMVTDYGKLEIPIKDVTSIEHASGKAGAWFSSYFLHLFGYLAFLFPFMVIYSGYLVFRERKNTLPNSFAFWSFRLFGLVFTLILGAAISAQHFAEPQMENAYLAGGILGQLTADLLVGWFNNVGATLLMLAAFFASMTLYADQQ